MSGFYCETDDSGEPPCQGVVSLRAECERLRAELAAAHAECARLREALVAAGVDDPEGLRGTCEMCDGDESLCHASCWVKLGNAALSTDAGRNWIDASGAVESEVITAALANGTRVNARVPDSWAGKPVLIVPKPEGWK